MTNHPNRNRSKQQQTTHTPSAFPELTREGLEELCLRQNQHVAELLAALKALLEGRPTEEPTKFAAIAHRNWELFEQARAAIAKAEGR